MNTNYHTNEKALREMTSSANGKNPFLVPEGYFDNLPDRVMSHIREDGQHSLLKRRHKSRFFIRLTAAAVLTGFFSLAGLMIYEQRHPLSNQHEGSPLTLLQEIEYTDELLDYAMLDNNDIEYYLTEAE
mgnify:FL=1